MQTTTISPELKRLILQLERDLIAWARLKTLLTDTDESMVSPQKLK
jgi:hypothetical protein